jgi:hypothetical protein
MDLGPRQDKVSRVLPPRLHSLDGSIQISQDDVELYESVVDLTRPRPVLRVQIPVDREIPPPERENILEHAGDTRA